VLIRYTPFLSSKKTLVWQSEERESGEKRGGRVRVWRGESVEG
jgi:hypothetical protein